jgi:hypothetical protein
MAGRVEAPGVRSAVLLAALLVAAAGCARRTPTAGFWYQDTTFALPARAAAGLGGPLTEPEMASIRAVSRREVERAFLGLNIRVDDDPSAFWRVGVVRSLPARGPLPNAGQSMPLGWMGGAGVGAVHNRDDERSYEYPSPDRSAQYYGDLHWTTARPFLERKLR